MPAKGSCCCDVIRAGTMWKVNVHTGETVVSLDYTHSLPQPPIMGMCAIDDYDACEIGSIVLVNEPNTRLWSKSGSIDWGPLSARTEEGFRGWAHFLNAYIAYGGSTGAGDILELLDRSDGDQVTHSMLGRLVYAEPGYVDAHESSSGTVRRYDEADLTTVLTSATFGAAASLMASRGIYASVVGTSLKTWDPSDLSSAFNVTLPFNPSAEGVDDDGGVYIYSGGAADRLLRYTSGTPDWDVVNAAYPTGVNRFGAFGNWYSFNTVTRILTKIDGSDGSIAWVLDYSAYAANAAGQFVPQQVTGHSGVLLLPYGTQGLIAIDDYYGTVIWDSPNKGYGKPIPDGADYVWCCGLYGT